ncbi:MAG: hypothetical protein K6347_04095 [Campylobacterales bacterium]
MKKTLLLTLLAGELLYAGEVEVIVATKSMDYLETVAGAPFSREESNLFGSLPGIGAAANFTLLTDDYGNIEAGGSAVWYRGSTDYTGSYQGGKYGSLVGTSSASILESELHLSSTQYLDKSTFFQTRLLAGYTSWERGLSSTQTEIYRWPWVGADIALGGKQAKVLEGSLRAGFEYALNPTMKWREMEYTFDLGGVTLWYFEVPMKIYEGPYYAGITLRHETQRIRASNTINGYSEPSSTTKTTTISLQLGYEF